MTKTMYLIGKGHYSDYTILAVFDDLQLAKQFIAQYEIAHHIPYIDDVYIEEYELNAGAQQSK